MTRYQEMKDKVREEAMEWQNWLTENSCSWEGLYTAMEYFNRKAKRYGLLTEFRENGII